MNKKLIALLLCFVMVIGVGCSSNDTKDEDSQTSNITDTNGKAKNQKVKITFLNTKGEIQAHLEEVAKDFTNEKGIELEIIPCGAGQSPFEKMTSMYASGNAPTLSMMDVGDLPKFKDKMLDLSSEKWVNDAMAGSLDVATIDNELLAFPFAVEGFGLIYNKETIENATGESFDHNTITTRDDLKNLFEKIEAGGTAPIIISPLDWSLGAHYTSIAYAAEGKNLNGINSIMDNLKTAKLDLHTNTTFNSLIDTFDLLSNYNLDKEDPLAGTYDTGAEAVSTGKSAFWFMGNWAWPQIQELSNGKGEFGFIPVPLDIEGTSNKLAAGPTKYVAVDSEQSTQEQQNAALTFLNWLVYEETGQNGLINKCSIIPAFLNINKAPEDTLAKSIIDYIGRGETIPMVLTFPSDYWKEVGAYMQKYLAKYSNREQLFDEIETYWKNSK